MKTIQTAPSTPSMIDHSITATQLSDVTLTLHNYGLARDIRDFLTALDEPTISIRNIATLFNSGTDRIAQIIGLYDWFRSEPITEESQLDHSENVSHCDSVSTVVVTPQGTQAALTDSVRGKQALTQELAFLSQPQKVIDDEHWQTDLRPDLLENTDHLTAESLREAFE